MLNYLRLRRRLRIDSTKKWFDDLNYISGLHIHDGEVDALAILVGEVRRQYVAPGSASGEPITDRSLVDDQIDVETFSLKGRMATSCARCDVIASTRSITMSHY